MQSQTATRWQPPPNAGKYSPVHIAQQGLSQQQVQWDIYLYTIANQSLFIIALWRDKQITAAHVCFSWCAVTVQRL